MNFKSNFVLQQCYFYYHKLPIHNYIDINIRGCMIQKSEEKLVFFLEYILRYNVIMPLPPYLCSSKTSYVPTRSLQNLWPF